MTCRSNFFKQILQSKLLIDIKHSKTYRSIIASLLAGLLLGVVITKEVHHLFGHCHEHPQCEANGGETHFHGAEFLHADCLLCVFNLSPEENVSFQFTDFSVPNISSETHFSYLNPFSERITSAHLLRGPPQFTI